MSDQSRLRGSLLRCWCVATQDGPAEDSPDGHRLLRIAFSHVKCETILQSFAANNQIHFNWLVEVRIS